nr:MAG TPA: hypothetical protein [Caudoviricetes sp.]
MKNDYLCIAINTFIHLHKKRLFCMIKPGFPRLF